MCILKAMLFNNIQAVVPHAYLYSSTAVHVCQVKLAQEYLWIYDVKDGMQVYTQYQKSMMFTCSIIVPHNVT